MSNLDELERLLEAATPGPWRNPESNGGATVYAGGHMDASTMVVADFGWGRGPSVDIERGHRDADLAVAAVNNLPALIAASRRAEALDRLEAALEQVERDGLIVLLGVGNPEERTDFTDAPAEVASALRATLAGEGAPR